MSDLILGDAAAVLVAMRPESVDAIVTDPPYDLLQASRNGSRRTQPKESNPYGRHERVSGGFMGKAWDATGVAFQPETWEAACRVLKPGGHLVAFGGTRTHHRLWCALEDAGFEIRDTLMWLYGSGFPKSLDVSKAIDKAAGAERVIVGEGDRKASLGSQGRYGDSRLAERPSLTAPATDAARQWEGWGTALKPAWEPIVLARKPLVGTVAANVQEHGTGALNVDGCRIGLNGDPAPSGSGDRRESEVYAQDAWTKTHRHDGNQTPLTGRWPANLVLDEEAAAMLDAQSGELGDAFRPNRDRDKPVKPGLFGMNRLGPTYPDSGGASRFFYGAKASREERGNGNKHPTVKPLALMRWLVRLITPPGGLILDPFIGSGTTAVAAFHEGADCIGIDNNAGYLAIAQARVIRAEDELRQGGKRQADEIGAGQGSMFERPK